MTANLIGTVYSGHPTRTTLGNTLRVLSYIELIRKKANILKLCPFVSGDDSLVIIER